jgi:hypothetical protein
MNKQSECYKRIIAIKERSAGNESVGSMWVDTASFDMNTPIGTILDWAHNRSGKLIISIDESTQIIEP